MNISVATGQMSGQVEAHEAQVTRKVTPQDTLQVTPQVKALLGAIVDAPRSRLET